MQSKVWAARPDAADLKRHHADMGKLLGDVKGIDAATVATLLAELPELGTLNRRQVWRIGGRCTLQP